MRINFIFLFSFLTVLSGCHKAGHPAGMAALAILSDLTDTMPEVQSLDANKVVSQLPENWDLSTNGVSVQFRFITDRILNSVIEVKLEPLTEGSEYNEIDRQNVIDTFNSRLQTETGLIRKMPKGRNSSIVFSSLFNALNELATYPKSVPRKLVLLSDCRENSNLFNAYKDIEELKTNPGKLKTKIEKECPVKYSLSGISVIIVHQPASVAEDEIFDIVSKFISGILIEKGATVKIQTSLN